jgi:hypothetical protein
MMERVVMRLRGAPEEVSATHVLLCRRMRRPRAWNRRYLGTFQYALT